MSIELFAVKNKAGRAVQIARSGPSPALISHASAGVVIKSSFHHFFIQKHALPP